MANLTSHSTVTVSYARSLIELATQQQQAAPVGDELRDVRQIVTDDPTVGLFFADPAISEAHRNGVLEKAFKNRVSPLVFNFLSVLNRHGRLKLLPQIAAAYDDLLDEQQGKIEVDVTVAQALSPEDLEQVRAEVGASLGKEAVIYQHVDDSIIGGMILRVQDRLIDGSVRTQLSSLKEKMLAAQPR